MPRTSQPRADTAIAYGATWLIVGTLVWMAIAQTYVNQWSIPLPQEPFAVVALISGALWLWSHRLVATHRSPRLRLVLAIILIPLALFLEIGRMWMLPALPFSAALLIKTRSKWTLLSVLCLGILVFIPLHDSWQVTLTTNITMMMLAGLLAALTRILLLVQELAASREQVARLRVDEERLRIQRDLHDLLGRTLVTVSMRTQTALRLLDKDLAAARTQLAETSDLVISGQAQLRELVAGRSFVGLEQELNSARDLCGRLAVKLDLSVATIDDPSTNDLAARILREAMTNMLKHSRPSHALIDISDEQGCTVVTIDNDGAVGLPDDTVRGTGLRDLRSRLENHMGGILETGPLAGGHFRLRARIPRSIAASQSLAQKTAAATK